MASGTSDRHIGADCPDGVAIAHNPTSGAIFSATNNNIQHSCRFVANYKNGLLVQLPLDRPLSLSPDFAEKFDIRVGRNQLAVSPVHLE